MYTQVILLFYTNSVFVQRKDTRYTVRYMRELLTSLRSWRAEEAGRRGIETYRILPNRTLEAIAYERPQTPEALLAIHGIGEKKAKQYGETILQIVSTHDTRRATHNGERKTENKNLILGSSPTSNFNFQASLEGSSSNVTDHMSTVDEESEWSKVCSVGEFLDRANAVLAEMPASVRGEVSSANIRERYVFFTIKDESGASMSCFMWRRDYDMSAVEAREGAEVIVRGFLEVYKPSGRLTFRARSVELVGEGALKVAYEKLKKKLEDEGLFSPERKRELPILPHRIGLITSKEGAVIHDFMSNIGKFGFRIFFVPSRVEGALAVRELVRSLRTLRNADIDVLVIIRGGGSLESLASFNNETLVREIATFPVPVLCGIGHDKDVPLASLVADKAMSTPTATARELSRTWEHALARVDACERNIVHRFERALADRVRRVELTGTSLAEYFAQIVDRCRRAEEKLGRCVSILEHGFENARERMLLAKRGIYGGIDRGIYNTLERVASLEKLLARSDPRRNLKLGYSIVSSRGRIVRSVNDVNAGDNLDILLADGSVGAVVKGK